MPIKLSISGMFVGPVLLAAASDSVWYALIGAAGAAFATYIGLKRFIAENQRLADERANALAIMVEKRMLAAQEDSKAAREAVKELADKQETRLSHVAAEVEKINVSTNGMSHRLEEAIKLEAFTRGGAVEKARAETEKAAVDAGVKAAGESASNAPAPEKLVSQIKDNKANADQMYDDQKDK